MLVQAPKAQFLITGFREVAGARVYAFESVAADRTRTRYTVRADLALSRRYGIRIQELPLLCRSVLEEQKGKPERAFTFTEQDMRRHADEVAEREEAARRRRSPRRPATRRHGVAPGSGWR